MATSKHLKGSSLLANPIMMICPGSKTSNVLKDNSRLVRCLNLHLGVRINSFSPVQIRRQVQYSRTLGHSKDNRWLQISVGETLSRINRHLDKIKYHFRTMDIRDSSKPSSGLCGALLLW